MIGPDTNVIVRYLVQDDPEQAAIASSLIDGLMEKDPAFLSLVSVTELYWVLRRAYRIADARCADLIEGLLEAREIRVDQDSVVRSALTSCRDGFDFAEAVIGALGQQAGCEHTVTFDRRAAEAEEMRLLVTSS